MLLRRSDALLPHELDVVREHAVIGGRILDAAGLPQVQRLRGRGAGLDDVVCGV